MSASASVSSRAPCKLPSPLSRHTQGFPCFPHRGYVSHVDCAGAQEIKKNDYCHFLPGNNHKYLVFCTTCTIFASGNGAPRCEPLPRHCGKKISVGYYSNVQKLAGRRTNDRIMVALTMCGRFPVLSFRFPASTLNVGRGFVHILCPLSRGRCLQERFVYWPSALITQLLMHHGKRQFIKS